MSRLSNISLSSMKPSDSSDLRRTTLVVMNNRYAKTRLLRLFRVVRDGVVGNTSAQRAGGHEFESHYVNFSVCDKNSPVIQCTM